MKLKMKKIKKKENTETKKKKNRGTGTGKVPPGVLAEWNLRGYVSPTQAAEIAGVARTTVYGWTTRKGALKSPNPKMLPPVVKKGPFKWLLRTAVEAMKPASVVDAAIAEAARTAS